MKEEGSGVNEGERVKERGKMEEEGGKFSKDCDHGWLRRIIWLGVVLQRLSCSECTGEASEIGRRCSAKGLRSV